jgi:hypothetical protein
MNRLTFYPFSEAVSVAHDNERDLWGAIDPEAPYDEDGEPQWLSGAYPQAWRAMLDAERREKI